MHFGRRVRFCRRNENRAERVNLQMNGEFQTLNLRQLIKPQTPNTRLCSLAG
jgi:hypothetical protein